MLDSESDGQSKYIINDAVKQNVAWSWQDENPTKSKESK